MHIVAIVIFAVLTSLFILFTNTDDESKESAKFILRLVVIGACVIIGIVVVGIWGLITLTGGHW